MNKKLAVAIFMFFTPTLALAHPGNTDASGCHTCRTNCPKWGLSQGEYHCHRSKGVEQPKAPVKSSATGVTVPAPEYKTPSIKTTQPSAAKKNTSTSTVKATTTQTRPKVSPVQKTWVQSFFGSMFGR